MSKLTRALNRSTSWVTDAVIATGVAAGVGFGLALLPLEGIPFIGPFIPLAGAGVAGFAIMERQRRHVRSPPASFE